MSLKRTDIDHVLRSNCTLSKKPLVKRVKNSIVCAGANFGYALAQKLPRRIGLILFGAVGAIAFLFPNRERTRTISHLEFIYGKNWSKKQIWQCARNVYVQLGKNLFDSIYLAKRPKSVLDDIIQSDSFDSFTDAYNEGKGVIAITAHTGCFEMLLHYFAIRGFKCFAIGKRMFDPRLEALVRNMRSGVNMEYMNKSENTRKMLRFLNDGKVFGVLIDQDTNVEGVFAPFLGYPAHTPSGPVKIAMKTGVPVFVATTLRQNDDRHYVYLDKLELLDTGDFEADLAANVAKANELICRTINKDPSQWVWMHRRWRRKPQETCQDNNS